MKKSVPPPHLTRRDLLRSAPLLCASAMLPRFLAGEASSTEVLSMAQKAGAPKPFSQFTDVAKNAGLTATMYYGVPDAVTYIIEEMGGGCAFFDYDNDGWIDIYILGGRTL